MITGALFCLLLFVRVHEFTRISTGPLIIGHRGVAYVPELTIVAQSMAYGYQADIIEIDVCLSRDDQLVVIHDIYLNGVSNVEKIFPGRKRADGLYYVIDFDLAELQRLTIFERIQPSNKSSQFPLRFPSNSNVSFHLTTLNETIELILGLNQVTGQQRQLLIEIKKPEYHSQHGKLISNIVINTLNAYNLKESTDPVIIQTFHIEELIRIRQNLASRLRLFALMTLNIVKESSSDYDFYRSEQGIRHLSKFVQALTPFHQFIVNYYPNGTIENSTNFTRWAHEHGLAVYPFTFRRDSFPGTNFEALIEYFWFDARVDGFITDHPDLIRKFLDRKLSRKTFELSLKNISNQSSQNVNYFILSVLTFLVFSLKLKAQI